MAAIAFNPTLAAEFDAQVPNSHLLCGRPYPRGGAAAATIAIDYGLSQIVLNLTVSLIEPHSFARGRRFRKQWQEHGCRR